MKKSIFRRKRYTTETKAQLVVLFDWLGKKGYASATKEIMWRLLISHEELAEWRDGSLRAIQKTEKGT